MERNRREVDRLEAAVREMAALLKTLTRPVLADLVRRGEQVATPDGYPASDRGGARGSGVSDPTVGVVVARQTPDRDVVGETLSEIFGALYEARGLLVIVDKRRKAVIHAGSLIKETATSVTNTCECCGRPVTGERGNRLKSGYGTNCCYVPWRRFSGAETDAGRDPSRVGFERWHANQHVDSPAACNPPSTSQLPRVMV